MSTVLYAGIVNIGRDPLPTSNESLSLPQPVALPHPEPLPPAPEFHRDTVPATEDLERPRRNIAIVVRDVDEQLLAEGGIATFHTNTGSDFVWFPLSTATETPEGNLKIETTAVCSCQLTVTFAARRAHARHGYLARTQIDLAQRKPNAPAVELAGSTNRVRFDLPTDADHAGPLRLQRVDDRMWLPMLHGTSGLELAKGRELSLVLGAGVYELQDPLHPEKAQQFEVPKHPVVVLSPSIARAPDDRP